MGKTLWIRALSLGLSLMIFQPVTAARSSVVESEPALARSAKACSQIQPRGTSVRFEYPEAPRSDTVDSYFGTSINDTFRPLESLDDGMTKTWISKENALTHCVLDSIPGRAAISTACRKLENHPKTTSPVHAGEHFFYQYNSGLQSQYVIYERDSEHGPARVFFDPNTLSNDGSIQLVNYGFTLDGSLMSYATANAGEDWRTWHVRNVSSGRDTGDIIHWTKFFNVSWDGNKGFYYSGYDAPTATDKTMAPLGAAKVWFHTLGTPQRLDRLVFAASNLPNSLVSVSVTHDNRFAILSQSSGSSNILSWRKTGDLVAPFKPFTAFEQNVAYSVLGNDGPRVYLRTTNGAPRVRIVWIDINDPTHSLHEIVPEASEKLQEASLIGDRFYLGYLKDAYSQVHIVSTSGAPVGSLELPGVGSTSVPRGRREDRVAYYYYSSYAVPGTIYSYDTKTMKSEVFDHPTVDFDSSNFVTEQIFATSKDGTKIPIFITHRKVMTYDGSNPTLLYGYGGFGSSETPEFSTSRAVWLEMGGVYADAVLRGGGEYGATWHDSGRLANKQNVFDDFTAAAQLLVSSKITSSPKLAIDGGSNGGLLVGAVLVQHPDLFGAAIIEQGVLDMLRYDKFTVGAAWIPEYGSASANANQFHVLLAYSPLQNIQPRTSYPPTLITTSDHDDRVMPAHSLKFAAALQEAQLGIAPILLRVQANEGHFSGLTTDESIDIDTDLYAFLVSSLKMKARLD